MTVTIHAQTSSASENRLFLLGRVMGASFSSTIDRSDPHAIDRLVGFVADLLRQVGRQDMPTDIIRQGIVEGIDKVRN